MKQVRRYGLGGCSPVEVTGVRECQAQAAGGGAVADDRGTEGRQPGKPCAPQAPSYLKSSGPTIDRQVSGRNIDVFPDR